MRIVIDTREQLPLRFSPGIETVRAALPVGDYAIEGLEDVAVVERKSLNDLLQSVSGERKRFVKELRQLRAYRFAAILIESSWAAIEMKQYAPNVHPNAVIGSLMSFAVKYGVVPIMAEDHATAGVLCERLLLNFARIVREESKALTRAEKAIAA